MIADRERALLASEPYRWPFSGDLTASRLAVVVTGAMSWFTRFCPGWAEVAPTISAVAAVTRSVGGLVVWTQHCGPGRHLPRRGDPAGALCVELEVAASDEMVTAAGLDAFYGGPLDRLLRSRRRDQVVLAGAPFETTVHSTLRSANDRGYECLTLLDATAAADPTLAGACVATICMSGGIFGAVGQSDAMIRSLASLESDPCPSPN